MDQSVEKKSTKKQNQHQTPSKIPSSTPQTNHPKPPHHQKTHPSSPQSHQPDHHTMKLLRDAFPVSVAARSKRRTVVYARAAFRKGRQNPHCAKVPQFERRSASAGFCGRVGVFGGIRSVFRFENRPHVANVTS